jgi:hypothetical protein
VFSAATQSGRRLKLAQMAQIEALSARGLKVAQVDSTQSWHGERGLYQLTVNHGGNKHTPFVTVLTIPADLPPLVLRPHALDTVVDQFRSDVGVGDQVFDTRWRLTTEEPHQARLLWTREARELLDALSPTQVVIADDTLQLVWRARDLPDLELTLSRVDRGEQLIDALARGRMAEVAQTLGLRQVRSSVLEGTLDGIPIGVHVNEGGTRIRALVVSPLRAVHRESKRRLGAEWPSQNPVIDQLLRVGGDTDARGLLDDPRFVEALLEVVHGWPESEVDPEGVTLVSPRVLLEELPDAVALVLRLARALEGPSR